MTVTMQLRQPVDRNMLQSTALPEPTWPQFFLKESFAFLRLYQGILEATWWGTCTLMSCVRNSTLHEKRMIAHVILKSWGLNEYMICAILLTHA